MHNKVKVFLLTMPRYDNPLLNFYSLFKKPKCSIWNILNTTQTNLTIHKQRTRIEDGESKITRPSAAKQNKW